MTMQYDDDALAEQLRAVVAEADPVPELVSESAHAAFDLRRLDAELAALVRDSADDPAAALAVRGEAEDRLLSFEVGEVTVEMQISRNADRRDILAHVSGAELADAAIETSGAGTDPAAMIRQIAVPVEDGILIARGLPAGLLRLSLTTAAGALLVTSWVRT
jgi:hypothetical protein